MYFLSNLMSYVTEGIIQFQLFLYLLRFFLRSKNRHGTRHDHDFININADILNHIANQAMTAAQRNC